MKTVLITLLAICVCLVIGCGHEPAAVETRNDPPELAEKPLPKDFESLKALAEEGDAEVQTILGMAYHKGTGVPKNFKEAVKWYRKAAEQGDAYAQFNLGGMYDDGKGVLEDEKEAAKWFRKAAEQGLADGQWSLGLFYYVGQGVEKDFKEAAKWYRKAAEQGYADAQFNLGGMYGMGEGVEQNYATAYAWVNIAAANGHEKAKSIKNFIAKDMTAEQIAKAQALSKEMIKKNPKLLKD